MRVDWYGQSAFRLTAGDQTVFIDPFGDVSAEAAALGLRWDYPTIEGVSADLLLVTHEHFDHNGVEAIGGDPAILRSTAGTHESPAGEVIGVASEHDEVAGTQRGPNTIFVFSFHGIRIAHFGDFGQSALRAEQREAIENVDLLFVPVGDGPTIGPDGASELVHTLSPRWVVPMHYRTPRVDFLDTADKFLARYDDVEQFSEPSFDTQDLRTADGPLIVVPAAP
jgi:L-ascorbate metabolism protein UlaG (beta-lactamase superfamily)